MNINAYKSYKIDRRIFFFILIEIMGGRGGPPSMLYLIYTKKQMLKFIYFLLQIVFISFSFYLQDFLFTHRSRLTEISGKKDLLCIVFCFIREIYISSIIGVWRKTAREGGRRERTVELGADRVLSRFPKTTLWALTQPFLDSAHA